MCESKVMCVCVSVLVNLSERLSGSCAVWILIPTGGVSNCYKLTSDTNSSVDPVPYT